MTNSTPTNTTIISIDNFHKQNLRTYFIALSNVCIILELHKIIIGKNRDQQIYKYSLFIENDHYSISVRNCPIEELNIDIDFLNSVSKLLSLNSHYIYVQNISIDIKLFIDISLKIIGTENEVKYFIYLDDKKIYSKENFDEPNNKFEIFLTADNLYYLLQLAPQIKNDYTNISKLNLK